MFWACFLVVLFLSTLPGTKVQFISTSDKLVHFAAFFVLSILLLFAYKFTKPFFMTSLLMAVFGIVIEVLQIYVPYRTFDVYDFLADMLGVMTALILFQILGQRPKIE
jgi:VanZ family protein